MGSCVAKQRRIKEFIDSFKRCPKETPEASQKSKQYVRLYFKAAKLKDPNGRASPSTFVVLTEKIKGGTDEPLGRTEIVTDDSDPSYATPIRVSYSSPNSASWIAEIRSCSSNLSLGSFEFSLEEIIKSESGFISCSPDKGKERLLVFYELETKKEKRENIQMKVEIDPCRSPTTDFYYRIYRYRNTSANTEQNDDPEKDNNLLLVYSSDRGSMEKENTYSWNPFKCDSELLILGDYSAPIVVELYVKTLDDKSGKSVKKSLLSEKTTINDIIREPSGINWSFICNGTEYGVLKLHSLAIDVQEEVEELEELEAFSVQLGICIDFTRTNLRSTHGGNNHTPNLNQNPYALVLRSIGSTLLKPDQKAILVGTGGKVPNVGRSHCFALNGNIFDPEITGVSKIIETYYNAIEKVKLNGPTIFSDALNYFADIVEEYVRSGPVDQTQYYVFLIIVDGSPVDIEETREALARCSALPTSVLIIGVNSVLCGGMDAIIAEQPMGKRSNVKYILFEEENTEDILKNIEKWVKVQAKEYALMNKVAATKQMAELRLLSPQSQVSSCPPSPAENLCNPFGELKNKLRRTIYTSEKSGVTLESVRAHDLDKEKSPREIKVESRETERNVATITMRTRSKVEDEEGKIERLLAAGFPTRDPYQIQRAAREGNYTNILLAKTNN